MDVVVDFAAAGAEVAHHRIQAHPVVCIDCRLKKWTACHYSCPNCCYAMEIAVAIAVDYLFHMFENAAAVKVGN
jgi:hypothetical protein